MRTLRRKTEKPERERAGFPAEQRRPPKHAVAYCPERQAGPGPYHVTLDMGLAFMASFTRWTHLHLPWLAGPECLWCCLVLPAARQGSLDLQTNSQNAMLALYIYIYIYIMILLQTFSFHSVSQFIANVSFLSFHIISQIPASQIFTVLIRFSCFTNIFSQFYSTLVSLCYSIFLRM